MDTFVLDLLTFMLKVRSIPDYPNLFSPNKSEKNDKKILKYFQYITRLRWEKIIALFLVGTKSLKILKYHKFLKKH